MARAAQRHARAPEIPAPLDLAVFRQMADMSNEAFYLTDRKGRFLYVNNRATAQMGGYSRDEILSMTVPDISPDFPPERFNEVVVALAHGSLPPFETLARRKDGSIYPVEVSVARLDVRDEVYLFGVVRDITERKHLETVQKNFTQRMLQTLEAERQRVARELHDDVGQAIATVGVLLHTLEQMASAAPEEARPALAATHATIQHITEAVARVVRDYHPVELLGRGLEETIRSHAHQFVHHHKLALRLATVPVAGLLSPELELHLYRIVQEALANVARHAHATRVAVCMARRRRRLIVTVRDNGVGFAVAPAPATGLGLVTMRERAELLSARLTVRSAPGRGAEVRVAVPVAITGPSPRPRRQGTVPPA